MKIGEAVKRIDAEPTLEERVKDLEARVVGLHAALISYVGVLAYRDEAFGEAMIEHLADALATRREDDAADAGG